MKELEARGVVERIVIDGPPVHVEYRLTEMGRALQPALNELRDWARRWLDEPAEGQAAPGPRTAAASR
jgi:DNA-binding HxlR family transcriptional regulator